MPRACWRIIVSAVTTIDDPPARARLCGPGGESLPLPGQRWLDKADAADAHVLSFINGPVLDIGCGPGRHIEALAERGEVALGVDLSPHAVTMCRDKGLAVLQRSVFDALPKTGQWQSALLLDGNIGIGGNPVELLRRVRSLLRPNGRVLVEVERHIRETERLSVRLEIDGEVGPWFSWSQLCVCGLEKLASEEGWSVLEMIESHGRFFGILEATQQAGER